MTVDHPGPESLTPEDDDFHPAESDHWWTETCWFSFIVPERDLMAYLYCWQRPNIACSGGGVLVWDASGEAPWELPYFDYQWNLPPAEGDMRDMVWPNGVGVRCLSPLQRYAVQYAKPGRIEIDIDFQGVMDPCLTGAHIDQMGHVTGQMTLQGERSEIDCFAMRDRSWGPRSDLQGMGVRVGYCYGTASPQTGFLLFTDIDDQRDDMENRYGYVIRDGERCDLVRAVRKVERSAGRPTHIAIEGEDAAGRAVEIRGECRNRLAFAPYPGMFCWLSLTRWELFGEVAWGENQDVWPPGSWRAQHESASR
ncbi:MAG: hypothetical protein HRU02_04760 [Myxococcales bacterium]|nr:hypothetical protein [Myxococcales bacterium]